MIVGAQQPYFLPWVGYWNKLLSVDVFIDMDQDQYERRDFFNRVTLNGKWLTVPTSAEYRAKVDTVKVCTTDLDKMVRTIKQTFAKAPYKDRLLPITDMMTLWQGVPPYMNLLNDLNRDMRDVVARALGIDLRGKIISAVPGVGETAQERLWSMLKQTCPQLTTYYAGGAGRAYMEPPYPHDVRFQTVHNTYGGDTVLKLIATEADPISAIRNAATWEKQ